MSDDANDPTPRGMKRGLTSYGDAGFSLFLRKAFIKGAGYSDTALDRPVIGITDTGSGYNPCHGNMPQLLDPENAICVSAATHKVIHYGTRKGPKLPDGERRPGDTCPWIKT